MMTEWKCVRCAKALGDDGDCGECGLGNACCCVCERNSVQNLQAPPPDFADLTRAMDVLNNPGCLDPAALTQALETLAKGGCIDPTGVIGHTTINWNDWVDYVFTLPTQEAVRMVCAVYEVALKHPPLPLVIYGRADETVNMFVVDRLPTLPADKIGFYGETPKKPTQKIGFYGQIPRGLTHVEKLRESAFRALQQGEVHEVRYDVRMGRAFTVVTIRHAQNGEDDYEP